MSENLTLQNLDFSAEMQDEVISALKEARLTAKELEKLSGSGKIKNLAAVAKQVILVLHPEREIRNTFVRPPSELLALSAILGQAIGSARKDLNILAQAGQTGPAETNPIIGEALALAYNIRFVADKISGVLASQG